MLLYPYSRHPLYLQCDWEKHIYSQCDNTNAALNSLAFFSTVSKRIDLATLALKKQFSKNEDNYITEDTIDALINFYRLSNLSNIDDKTLLHEALFQYLFEEADAKIEWNGLHFTIPYNQTFADTVYANLLIECSKFNLNSLNIITSLLSDRVYQFAPVCKILHAEAHLLLQDSVPSSLVRQVESELIWEIIVSVYRCLHAEENSSQTYLKDIIILSALFSRISERDYFNHNFFKVIQKIHDLSKNFDQEGISINFENLARKCCRKSKDQNFRMHFHGKPPQYQLDETWFHITVAKIMPL